MEKIPHDDDFVRKWQQGNGRNLRYRELKSFVERYPEIFDMKLRGRIMIVSWREGTTKFEDPAPNKHLPMKYINGFMRQLYRDGVIKDDE